MAEADDHTSDSGGGGLLMPRTGNALLLATLVVAMLAGTVLFWLATWTLYDHRPTFDDTLGAGLAETSRGLFIGAGLLGAVLAVRVLRELERLVTRLLPRRRPG